MVLLKYPVALIGYDLGGAVAAGFAAKFPHLCKSLSFIGSTGIKYSPFDSRFLPNFFGEIYMARKKKRLPFEQVRDFFDTSSTAKHRFLIDRQIAMSQWQIKNSVGYLPSLLSTYRMFPFTELEELYTAIGRHPRKVLVIWGDQDKVCPYQECIKAMEESFPNGEIVDIARCGHNSVFECFEDVIKELLSFHRDVFRPKETRRNRY